MYVCVRGGGGATKFVSVQISKIGSIYFLLQLMLRQSVMFELEIPRHARNSHKEKGTSAMTSHMPGLYGQHNHSDVVLLKGQMKHMPDLNGMAFLCTPL